MNFTQEQISDLLFDLASEKGGTHLLLNLTLDAFMKAQWSLHQKENSGEYANSLNVKTKTDKVDAKQQYSLVQKGVLIYGNNELRTS